MSVLENRQREPSKLRIVSKPTEVICGLDFNMKQAIELKERCGSAGKALNWVYTQLYSEHGFELVDRNKVGLDIECSDQHMLWKLDTLGGKKCLEPVMKRYLRRAKGKHRNKLPAHLEFFATAVYFALEIAKRSEQN